MRKIHLIASSLLLSTLAACSGGSDSNKKSLINPSDANAVSAALDFKIDGVQVQRVEGSPPAATSTGSEPVISNLLDKVNVSNGETVKLQATVSSSAPLTQLFSKVVGADDYFQFGVPSTKASGSFEFEIKIPDNILDGEYCQTFSAQDAEALTSSPVTVCFAVESTLDDTPPPSNSGSSAAACFNPAVWAAGSELALTYTDTDTFSGETYTETNSYVRSAGGQTTFDGRPAQAFTETDSFGDTDTFYAQIDNQRPSVNVIGSEYTDPDGDTDRDTFNPGLLFRFDLEPGERYTQQVTYTNQYTFNGQTETTTSTEQVTTIYRGRSTQTVPAGTFETCEFDWEITISEQGETYTVDQTFHFGVGNGLFILTTDTFNDGTSSYSFRSELQSATINGTPVR